MNRPSTSRSLSSPVWVSLSFTPADLLVAEDLLDGHVRVDLDLGVGEGPVDHDLARPERVAPMEQVDLRREPGQVGRLLERRVATADDGDLAVAEEEPVARRAGRHAAPAEARLAVEPEPQRRRAGGDDHRLAAVLGAARPDPERPRRRSRRGRCRRRSGASRSARPGRGTCAIRSGPWMPSGKPG